MNHRQKAHSNWFRPFPLALLFLLSDLLSSRVTYAQSPPQKDPIVGRWRWFSNEIITVQADGTATSPGGSGTWKCVSTATPPTYEINWRHGLFIDTLRVIKGGKELKGKNQQGVPVSATRLPDK